MVKLNKPLHSYQIERFGIPVIEYDKFRNMTLDKLVDILCRYKGIVILYLNASDCGHYCALLKCKRDIIFFDPYGIEYDSDDILLPDSEIDWDNDFRKYSGDKKLIYLLKDLHRNGTKIYANHFPFQIYSNNISTCGYHCLLRIFFSDFSEKKYNEMMQDLLQTSGLNNFDELVVSVLSSIIK
jgi:hypothetical protein